MTNKIISKDKLETISKIFIVTLLGSIYMVASFRFFPDELNKSLWATGDHYLRIFPVSGGITLICISIFQKITQQKMPVDRAFRIFFVTGIFIEILLGINDHLSRNPI
jgi:hypothetical protein